MTAHRCAILDDYQDVALSLAPWGELAGEVEIAVFNDQIAPDRLVETLQPFDIIVAMRERTPFDAALLRQLPNLRLLITTGMRNAAIDMQAARDLGIVVSGTGSFDGTAAELAWALLLAVMRNIPAEAANFRNGGSQWQLTLGRALRQKTLGIVGLGKLGKLVAGYGKAFQMDVVGWSKNNSPQRCAEIGIGYAETLDGLLSAADVVSLHVVLNGETRGIIGARELELMKPGAVIVNASRGPLIDEAALIAALRSGRLGGAGLDVYDEEPLPADHPLRTLPNVVATPHLGYVTRETYDAYFSDALDDVRAWLKGAPVRVLNAPTG
ncbi:D-2-hydroxyacid dehydrogenase family protein [Microbaculum marinum]|uniref:D-2-hydroxyacid dehydrogenase family protein n=1 Tax=Microbaculum marinum TaxID=1764581 RepID=A0AAW9RVM0_9HYPH